MYAVTLGDYEKKKRQEKRGKSAAKKKRKSDEMDVGTLEDMAEKIDKLVHVSEVNEILVRSLKEAFKCNICLKVARRLTVSKCCQRLLGCGPCLETWFGGNPRCPICKNEEGREKQFLLKGFDDFDAVISKLEDN